MKKFVSVLLAVLMVIALFSGMTACSKDDDTEATTTTAKDATTTTVEEEPTYTFKLMQWNVQMDENSEVIVELGKRLGVKFTVYAMLPSEMANKLNILAMSDNLPDVMTSLGAVPLTLREQISAEITVPDIKKYMPEYWKKIVDIQGGEDQAIEKMLTYLGPEGKQYALPIANLDYGMPHASVWRADIVESLGFEIPKTLDECEAVFAAFKADNPDGYPIYDMALANFMGQYVFGAYGITQLWGESWYYDPQTDMVVTAVMTPNYKLAIEKLRDWYEKGYINPEYITANQDKTRASFANGDSLIDTIQSLWVMSSSELNPNGYEAEIRKTQPQAKLAFVGQLQSELYPEVKYSQRTFDSMAGWNMFIGRHNEKSIQPDRFKKLLQTINALGSDQEIYLLANYGIEGKHWEWGSDNEVKPLPGFEPNTDEGKNGRFAAGIDGPTFCSSLAMGSFDLLVNGSKYKKAWDEYATVMDFNGKTKVIQYHVYTATAILNTKTGKLTTKVFDPNGDTILTPELGPVMAKHNNFITGEWPMSQYDSWMEDVREAGIAALEEAYNRLYLASYKKQYEDAMSR